MSEVVEVTLGKQGRLVIPAELRRLLDLHEGDRLVVQEENGRLVLEKPEMIGQRLKALFSHLPSDKSLSDELIAERREAAKLESRK
jgi:AbrB family looped-hinge helix DNA binding protein